ncbi:hypothetical protein Q0812_13445 [Brevundimonas sp. 2R-24]|uniref:Uncharacterized protein n=1 Tax=Peiella sedimenti TaxID=3061083 RepID=A0ABT8SQQ1_9CAUL|nr:hypothetical protein [Caulobacteraceae bacterium XZ-24]
MTKPAARPDTPMQPPVTTLEQIKAFVGDLARPFCLISMSLSASIAAIIIANKVENGTDGAIALGAIGVIVGGMYGFKAWENTKAGRREPQADA